MWTSITICEVMSLEGQYFQQFEANMQQRDSNVKQTCSSDSMNNLSSEMSSMRDCRSKLKNSSCLHTSLLYGGVVVMVGGDGSVVALSDEQLNLGLGLERQKYNRKNLS